MRSSAATSALECPGRWRQGLGLAVACWATGRSVSAIIRNQSGAIETVLALLYVAEPLLGFIPHLGVQL